MKNTLFILTIALFFSACTPKITLETLHAPKINNPNIRQLAVIDFKNDTIGQASSIETLLANITFDEKPYFTLVQRNNLDLILNEKKLNDSALVELNNFDDMRGLTQVKTLLQGEVLQSTLHQKVYFKSEKNYQHCLEYNKNKECIKFPTRLIRCQTNDYNVQTQIKIVEVISSDILFTQIYTQSDSLSQCNNGHFLPSKQQHNTYLAQRIAQNVIKDLAPHYVAIKVALLEDADINLSKIQTQQLKNALDLLSQARFKTANSLLERLNTETQEQSYVILYNLALSYEALEQIKIANDLYKKAEGKSLGEGMIDEISNAIIRTNQTLLEEAKINKLEHY